MLNTVESIPASWAPAPHAGMTLHTAGEEDHYLWNAFKMGFGWPFNVRLLQKKGKIKRKWEEKGKWTGDSEDLTKSSEIKNLLGTNQQVTLIKRNDLMKRLNWCLTLLKCDMFCSTLWKWVFSFFSCASSDIKKIKCKCAGCKIHHLSKQNWSHHQPVTLDFHR